MTLPDLSIVLPAFDEAESLDPLLDELEGVLAGSGLDWEVIVVDDGSGDATPDVLARRAAAQPRLTALRLEENRGQSAALLVGIERARGRVVVTMDADLQNDPADIPRLVAALEGVDAVSGVRRRRRDDWLRRLSSQVANRVRGAVLGDGIRDIGCSLKAYRRELLERVPPFDGLHRFLPAVVQMEAARVVEIEVAHRPRRHGVSKYGVHNRLWRGILDLVGVRWLQRRWIRRPRVKEIAGWRAQRSGSSSASSDRASSSVASSSSGSSRSGAGGA